MNKYTFIDAQKASFPIRLLCRVCAVPESSYFDWDRTGRDRAAARAAATEELVGEIRQIHVDSDATFGSPRVHDALRKEGRKVAFMSGGGRDEHRGDCWVDRPGALHEHNAPGPDASTVP